MKTEQERKNLFQELIEWSNKKDSYSMNDFFMLNGLTEQQGKAMIIEEKAFNRAISIAIGKAICQCVGNSYKAWKFKEISRDQFSEYLIQSGIFKNGDVESFDRCSQEYEKESGWIQHGTKKK